MSPLIGEHELRRRITGCWLGKAVGGTLGQVFEGREGPLSAAFYEPVPTEMIPNDDLDLQVLWALLMSELDEPRVDRAVLERGWLENVEFPWNEYGVAIRNLREGIPAPQSGSHDNWYTCGEGAVIRSELWACLAAGDPALAAEYAYEDACVDHAGDGIEAARFMASVQAAAFVESDPDRLLDLGLAAIPADSALARAVRDTRSWVSEGLDWREVRERILDAHGSIDFTDVRMNTAFVVLGWLAGRDFGERILICNNCGKDTDSSTASLGALLGILDPDAITEDWLAPIGRALVLSPEITGVTPPDTLDGFTDLVIDLRRRLDGAPARPTVAEPVEIPPFVVRAGFTNYFDREHIGPRFMPRPTDPEPSPELRERILDGTWHRMSPKDFEDEVMVIEYRFELPEDRLTRVMFNSPEYTMAWLDGEFAFGRETGSSGEPAAYTPALHGPPLNQYVDRELATGEHRLRVAVRRPIVDREVEWVFGVGDPVGGMWFPGVIR